MYDYTVEKYPKFSYIAADMPSVEEQVSNYGLLQYIPKAIIWLTSNFPFGVVTFHTLLSGNGATRIGRRRFSSESSYEYNEYGRRTQKWGPSPTRGRLLYAGLTLFLGSLGRR